MKTFSRILSEVAQPNSEDELNFKEKHIIDPKDHPVAPEEVFSGNVDKDDIDGMKRYRKNKRLADYQRPEDEAVYEGIDLKRDIPGQEDDDVDNDGDKDMTDAQYKYRKHAQIKLHRVDESWSDGVSSRTAHVHARTAAQYRNKAKDSASMAKQYEKGSPEHSKYMAAHHSAMAKSIKSSYHGGEYPSMAIAKRDHKEEIDKAKEYKSKISEDVEQINELKKSTLDSYNNKASDSIRKNIWKSEGGSRLSDKEKQSDRKRSKGMDNADAKLGGYAKINAKEEFKLDEAVFVIPEEILATEKNAFHTAAANAHAAGKKHFAFAGKKYPVTMSKGAAKTFAGKGGMSEAMDPVGKEDDDINNDGKVNKSDKYLHARRKAISASIRTKIKEGFGPVTPAGGEYDEEESHQRYKKSNSSKKEDVALSHDGKGSKIYAGKTKDSQIDEAMTHSTWNVQHPTKPTQSYKVKARTAGEAIRKAHKAAIDAGHMKSNVPDTVFKSKHIQKVNEEVEELDELKKSTLSSYIKKATPSAMDQGVKGMDFKNENRPKHFNKAMRRMTGIQKAADKLAKEEVEQIDELSKKTLGSYVNKAAADIGYIQRDITSGSIKDPEYKGLSRMRKNRKTGIANAVNRLTKESVEQLDERYETKKADKKMIGDKEHTIHTLHHDGEEIGRIYPHSATSQTKARGSRIATSQKKVVRWGYQFHKDKGPESRYPTTGMRDKNHAAEEAIRAHSRWKEANESFELDEAVEVRHDRYMRSHGKKASGGTGSWMFTHKAMGDVDHKNEKEVYSAPSGKFSDAKKAAQQWAKKHGHHSVYVMEEVEQIDEISKDTLRSYAAKSYNQANTLVKQSLSDQPKSVQKASTAAFKRRSGGIKAAGRRLGSDEMKKIHADVVREDVEELDELKKSTLGSYVRKASVDAYRRGQDTEYHTAARDATDNYGAKRRHAELTDKARSKASNRIVGIEKATQRLAKEEVEQIDEISKSTLGSYATKALRRGDIAARMSHSDSDEMGKIANKRLTGAKQAVDKLAPKGAATRIKTSIDKAREAARNRGTEKDDEGKAYYAAQKGIAKVREEVEQIDELKRSTLASYVKKAAGVGDRNSLPNAMKDQATAAVTGDREWYKKSGRTATNRSTGIQKAANRLAKEEVELDEAFNAGSLKLNDGTTVSVKPQDAKLLNKLIGDLRPENAKKMMKVAMTDKVGFNEILGFAREAL